MKLIFESDGIDLIETIVTMENALEFSTDGPGIARFLMTILKGGTN
jgi:hypothetical protein